MGYPQSARFDKIGKLGQGGMGIVYEAFDRSRGMRVALKTLRQMSAGSLLRFKREFRVLRDISHPNIITLYELVSEGDDWFLTMELIDGENFIRHVQVSDPKSRRDDGTPSLEDVLSGATPDTRPSEPNPSATGRLSALIRKSLGTRSRPSTQRSTRSQPSSTGVSHSSVGSDLDVTLGAASPGGRGRDTSAALPRPPKTRLKLADLVHIDRLRDVLGQLAQALHVLHSAGVVHRDLKPSNVLVTREGRAVLMDFGVVAEVRGTGVPRTDRTAIGTPYFMAPEQALGAPPTAAADWYAFGMLIYLALAARYPYHGSEQRVLRAKQDRDPLRPSAYVDGVPQDLERLCMDLLQRPPAQRPTGPEILDRLGIERPDASSLAQASQRAQATRTFVGRATELATVQAARRAARSGQARCVFVQGPSGMGKTSLVSQFTGDIAHAPDERAPVILSGRCHERETLPYKAFDGVLDDLTHHLSNAEPGDRRSVIPDQIAALTQVFPVLLRVPECAAGPPIEGVKPVMLRGLAISVLATLLGNLARDRLVVVTIEDLQWADRDSLDVLDRLLTPPRPPGLLIIATLRSEALDATGEASAHLLQCIADITARGGCDHIDVGPLSDDEQRELVTRLVPHTELLGQLGDDIWQESAGHPLLLVELARYAQHAPDEIRASAGSLQLEDVIWRRLTRLPDEARALIEVIAIAGEPLPARILAQVAGLSDLERERAMAVLCTNQLARVVKLDDGPWLAAYHDKVRESAARRLPDARTTALHRQLAQALTAWDAGAPAMMSRHWLGAGDPLQAAACAIRAARDATSQLAFDRAAAFYHSAIDILGDDAGTQEAQRLRCQAWIGLAGDMRVTDRNDEAMDILLVAERVAMQHELIEELATIFYTQGNLLFPRGDIDGCLDKHQQARIYARRAGSREREARALSGIGDAHYMRGHMISAHAHFDECIELCRAHGFRDIEVANLSMRGMTRYYQNDLDTALRDSVDAAAFASMLGRKRAEIVARNGCVGWLLYEMARLDEARREFERALELARSLGARRFEPNSLTFLAKLSWLSGDLDAARDAASLSVAICRDTGFAFVGPMALGALILVTDDPDVRERALAEGDAILARGTASHNFLYFCRDAMDAALHQGDPDRAERYASLLETYTADEPLPWSQFFIARARALVSQLRGGGDPAVLTRLVDEARRVGLNLAARALERAAGDVA